MFRLEHNVETGEVLEIELTDAELKAFNDDALRIAAEVAALATAQAEAEAAKQAATDKLAAIGLTTDDLKALGL